MIRGWLMGAVLSMFVMMTLSVVYYKSAYERSLEALSGCKKEADVLIATLKSKELKLKEYLEQKPKIEQKIITKYKVIKQKDESCQSFKEGVNEVLHAFYSNPPP